LRPNINGMTDEVGTDGVTFRYLQPPEGAVLTEAIHAAYGDTYDVRWVYDPAEVSARLRAGTYISCVAESANGELLCHEGMSLGAAGDAVATSARSTPRLATERSSAEPWTYAGCEEPSLSRQGTPIRPSEPNCTSRWTRTTTWP
jgi:hypothetical protein